MEELFNCGFNDKDIELMIEINDEILDLSNNEKQSIKENDTTDNNINETTNNTTKEEKQPIELNGEIAFCRKCGTQLLSDSEFCHKCGCERVRWKKTT